MAYQSLRFNNFRNLEDRELELDSAVYFLVGNNGAGKSSLLETLYLLSYGSSFREKNLLHCMRSPEQDLRICGEVQQQGQSHSIAVRYTHYPKAKKNIQLDQKTLYDRKELLFISPSIIFAHNDIEYISGAPKSKRLFIDQTISLLSPNYLDLVRNYSKCLAQRNWILKNKQHAFLETYSLQLVEIGLEIQRARALHIPQLNAIFSQIFHFVSGMQVELRYLPSWDVPQNLPQSQACEVALSYLAKQQHRDFHLGSSQSGVHRDQITFSVAGAQQGSFTDFTKLASTGQLRLAALALKSAQANYLEQSKASPSVLLLDDVLLEMDVTRRKLFLSSLPPYQQVFFTFLPSEDVSCYPFESYQILHIADGKIRAQS